MRGIFRQKVNEGSRQDDILRASKRKGRRHQSRSSTNSAPSSRGKLICAPWLAKQIPKEVQVKTDPRHVGPISFRPVLALGPVQGVNAEGPIIRYRVIDQTLLREIRGVYVIVAGDQIVYCGKWSTSFAKRWLYTRGEYVYHFKRNDIASSIAAGFNVTVFAQTERALQHQLRCDRRIDSIEADVIHLLSPTWNKSRPRCGTTRLFR